MAKNKTPPVHTTPPQVESQGVVNGELPDDRFAAARGGRYDHVVSSGQASQRGRLERIQLEGEQRLEQFRLHLHKCKIANDWKQKK